MVVPRVCFCKVVSIWLIFGFGTQPSNANASSVTPRLEITSSFLFSIANCSSITTKSAQCFSEILVNSSLICSSFWLRFSRLLFCFCIISVGFPLRFGTASILTSCFWIILAKASEEKLWKTTSTRCITFFSCFE